MKESETYKGAEFWDNEAVSDRTISDHDRDSSPNNSLERPVIVELVGEVTGKDILDLGCGDGNFGLELLNAGCRSYLGIESSSRMVDAGRELHRSTGGEIVHGRIEDWDYPADRFDLVVSRLALHYVDDLRSVFGKVHFTLRADGLFVFSIVHPVITSSDKSREISGTRYDWIVDDYFTPGPRKVRFLGEFVEQFHRPLQDIYSDFQAVGFTIQHLKESMPRAENFEDSELFERRKRIPLMLFLSGLKS